MSTDLDALLRACVRDVPDFPMPGVVFKDITPLLANPSAFTAAIDALGGAVSTGSVDRVVGIEARGFVLAAALAGSLSSPGPRRFGSLAL